MTVGVCDPGPPVGSPEWDALGFEKQCAIVKRNWASSGLHLDDDFIAGMVRYINGGHIAPLFNP
jgi:hypothetical protein